MLAQVVASFLALIFSSPLWAMTCYYTLAKDNCWTNYEITVQVVDAVSSKELTTVKIPSGQSWTRQTFSCEPGQKLMYKAQFAPMIWESERGKTYSAKNYWSLPKQVNPSDSAWNVQACYASDFSEVPLPPEAVSTCSCNFDVIPAIPPKKI